MEFLDNAYIWVTVAFIGFIAMAWKPAGSALTKALDGRAEKIRTELEEATRLKEEAQAVLASYQQRERESLKDAEEIIAKARQAADKMRQDAEVSLKAALETRTKLAMEKIAQAEAAALQDVQNNVADVAINAARSIILDHMDASTGQQLVSKAISDIERKVH